MSQTGALSQGESKEVKVGLTRLAPDSWKSARGQNVLLTSALGRGGSLYSEKSCAIWVV